MCIICNEGSTSSKRLTNNPDMIDKLVDCCNERLSLGQSDIKQLSDRLASLSESERKHVCYHSECRKPIVNMSMIARLRRKRVRSDSPVCPARSPGRPINTTDSARPKRTKSIPKAKVCVFSSCSFCPNDTVGSLHRALSDGIGESLIEIKLNTQLVQNTRSDRQVNRQPKKICFSILPRRPCQWVCPSPSIPESVTRTSSITYQKCKLGGTTGGSLTLKSV